MLGTYVLSAGYYDAYYLKAQQVRTLIRRDYDQAFERVDVVDPRVQLERVIAAAGEFAAMITAVNKWALEKAEWNHPLPAIKTALEQKTALLHEVEPLRPTAPDARAEALARHTSSPAGPR